MRIQIDMTRNVISVDGEAISLEVLRTVVHALVQPEPTRAGFEFGRDDDGVMVLESERTARRAH